MSRQLRTTLATMMVVLLFGAPLVFAHAPTPTTSSYLALIFQNTPPPALETLVIQLSEMPELYQRSYSEEVTNAQAAVGYPDPVAAAAAFAAQGRETSWRALYTTTIFLTDEFQVTSQVYRYQTPTGATQGLAYSVAELKRRSPDFQEVTVNLPNTVALHHTFTYDIGGATFEEYVMISQVGRYVTQTQTMALKGSLPLSRALTYTQLGLNHLTAIPQASK
jgi:hypothetical protein